MEIIYTDPKFKPYGDQHYTANFFTFPSGLEVHTNGEKIPTSDHYVIVSKMRNTGDIFKILMITDILQRKYPGAIDLVIPYLPYARQDRVSVDGDPLSIKIFAKILNTQDYRKVHILDHHSDVSRALVRGDTPIPTDKFLNEVFGDMASMDFHLVCPDAGASKKMYNVAKAIGYTGQFIQALKHRDTVTGHLTDTQVIADDLGGQDCYIVDDICSKGGTFIALAKKLREKNCGKIYLVVSHYEGSADPKVLSQYIDHVYTTDSIIDESTDFITVHKIDQSWIHT